MRRFPSLLSIAVLFLTCSPPFMSACGDKLLVLGRGVKFGNIASSYHASIIAYIPEAQTQSAVNDAKFQVSLQKAGHKLQVIHEEGALAAAVQSDKCDIVLADPYDAELVERQIAIAGVNTVVLPVIYDTPQLKAAAITQLRCVRKLSGKNNTCFSTIDKAIELKLKRDELRRRAGN